MDIRTVDRGNQVYVIDGNVMAYPTATHYMLSLGFTFEEAKEYFKLLPFHVMERMR